MNQEFTGALKIQVQASNGGWYPATDENHIIDLVARYNGFDADGNVVPAARAVRALTRDEALLALHDGDKLRTHDADWYSNCQSVTAADARYYLNHPEKTTRPAVKMVKCDCGHTIISNAVMHASTGTSCFDCYDRMS